MPTLTIPMRKIREILRLHHEAGLSYSQIGRALGLSKGVVGKYVGLCRASGVGWPLPDDVDDAALEARLFSTARPDSQFVLPDYAWVHQELKRKGVTLQLLWEEYSRGCAKRPLRYTAFCVHYRGWASKLRRSMRQVHHAGEKLFIDYAGPSIPVVCPETGEIRPAWLFVAVLGASNYTYAEATWSQAKSDWIGAQAHALAYIGGVPELLVPDNPKALITQASRYEPEPNRTYEEFAAHYGTAILPARPRKPRDKAKVEAGVLVAERWILARLRHHRFFSLAELNGAIAPLLEQLNLRPFKKLPGCRRSAFETLDRPVLKPLPLTAYEYAEWKRQTLWVDYHVEVDDHYYSAPHPLVGQKLDIRITRTRVEAWFKNTRVANHARSYRRGHTTLPEHMPKSHRAHLEWSPGRLLNWGLSIGPRTRDLVKWQLENRRHPEQGYRSCLGLLNLAKRYGPVRLEGACQRALAIASPTYQSVSSILKNGLDQQAERVSDDPQTSLPLHENVRGPSYYH